MLLLLSCNLIAKEQTLIATDSLVLLTRFSFREVPLTACAISKFCLDSGAQGEGQE